MRIDHSISSPPGPTTPGAERPVGYVEKVTARNRNFMNSTYVTSNNFLSIDAPHNTGVVPTIPDLPTAPITLHGASYRIVEFDNRRVVIRRVAPGHCVLAPRDVAAAVLRGVEVDALVPSARRSGLAAVAQVADARGCWL